MEYVATSDGLEHIKFLNRDASFLRNGFNLSQLDGEGSRQTQLQQEQASKEAYTESLLKTIAINTGSNVHDLRNKETPVGLIVCYMEHRMLPIL